MSPNPFGSLPTSHRLPGDPPQDEGVTVDGLERALAQARTKLPEHDTADSLGFPTPREAAVRALKAEVPAPVPFDSRAVMDVLRGAIDRYTHGDGHKQGAWVNELAQAKDNAQSTTLEEPPPRHLEAGYAPDRRLLAAVVVGVFLVVGVIGYTQFGIGSGGENVKTETPITVQGRAVTTVIPTTATAPTTVPVTAAPTEPSTEPAPATTAETSPPPPPPTTARPATTAPPPPATTAPPPPTTAPPPSSTTTVPCGNLFSCP